MGESSRMFANMEARIRAASDAASQTFMASTACTTPDCVATQAKVNSMGFMGRLFGPATYNVYYNTSANTFGVLFYIALTIFIIFLLMMFVHFTMLPIFSFSVNDTGFIPIPTASDQQTAYKKGPPRYDLSANFVKMPACTYTLGADVYLSGIFMGAQIPRVILYRSGVPVSTDSVLTGITDSTSDDDRFKIMNTYLKSKYEYTNIIAWLDPLKNDLYVSAITNDPDGGSNSKIIQTSRPVENVPIKRVFRLAIVFTPNFLEVYINGKLEQSMPIKNPLIQLSKESYIYPTVNSIQNNVMIGTLSMWPRVLTAREIDINESKPRNEGTFFTLKTV
jgi:hypothetical protein